MCLNIPEYSYIGITYILHVQTHAYIINQLISFSKNSIAAAACWKSVPLPQGTPGYRCNVARRGALGGDPTCVPLNFNSTMLSVWEEISVMVNTLLHRYREHCTTVRKRSQHSSESPAALLPVSFSQAKDWLLKCQKVQSEPSKQVPKAVGFN